ncbi:MAG: divergent polysaccharide deacetylase family protein [Fibrobacter sp.]|nr:divergent polysaccharide deacetylase family protein [Fibrobacter sp.]
MKSSKHIIAVIIVLSVLGAILLLLPKTAEEQTLDTEPQNTEIDAADSSTQVSAIPEDTVSFETKLKEELGIVQETKKKGRPRTNWTLGRGKTIVVYLLQAKRFIEKHGGTVLAMEELHDPKYFQSANLDLLNPSGDTLKLQLQVSDNIFISGASILAIGFQVTSLTPELIAALNKLEFPYDLLVQPFGMNETFYPDLDRIQNKEIILWLTMESTRLYQAHLKYRPLRIHHTEDQIATVITDAKKLIPDARGIATRFGEQAMEHTQLLKAILNPAEKNNLWFLDITENKQSKIHDVCKGMRIFCKVATPYNPEHSSLQDYVNSKTREASKNGLATMILPLKLESINLVEELSKKMEKQGTTLVNLSTFMTY